MTKDEQDLELATLDFAYDSAHTSGRAPMREVFAMLAADRGWSADQFESWAHDKRWPS